MTERRIIKQRSPTVWARVKEAYLAGEPAASVARRFDVGYGNLRYRAHAEGWTRKAAMATAEQDDADEARRLAGRADAVPDAPPAPEPVRVDTPPPSADPREALDTATRRAAALLAEGRAAEATVLLKAVEALDRQVERAPAHPLTAAATDPEVAPEPIDDIAAEQELYELRRQMESHIYERACELAESMLSDMKTAPHLLGAFALHWRAETFGPECAALDFERCKMETNGSQVYWNDDGSLLPLEELFDVWWVQARNLLRARKDLPFRKEWVRPEPLFDETDLEETRAWEAEMKALKAQDDAEWG